MLQSRNVISIEMKCKNWMKRDRSCDSSYIFLVVTETDLNLHLTLWWNSLDEARTLLYKMPHPTSLAGSCKCILPYSSIHLEKKRATSWSCSADKSQLNEVSPSLEISPRQAKFNRLVLLLNAFTEFLGDAAKQHIMACNAKDLRIYPDIACQCT